MLSRSRIKRYPLFQDANSCHPQSKSLVFRETLPEKNKEQRLGDPRAESRADQSHSSQRHETAAGFESPSGGFSPTFWLPRASSLLFESRRVSEFCKENHVAFSQKNAALFEGGDESRNSCFLARKGRARTLRLTLYPHTKMAALSAVAPVLNKAPVVSTGKAANTNSMMVWQPHGNKCVRFPAFPRSPARPPLSFASRARDLRRRRALRRRGSRRSLP